MTNHMICSSCVECYMLLSNLVTHLSDVAIEMYRSYSLKWSPLGAETYRSDPLLIKRCFSNMCVRQWVFCLTYRLSD